MNGKKFFEKLPKEFSFEDRNKIEQAYHFAKFEHIKQVRDEGERYFNHPRRVALYFLKYKLLLAYGSNEITPNHIITALLHDVIEDCYPPHGMIRALFGEEVESRVFDLSKKIPVYDKTSGYIIRKIKLNAKEYLRKMAKDGGGIVCMIKMADRLDNVRTMQNAWPRHRQLKYIQETKMLLSIFVRFSDTQIYCDLQKEVSKFMAKLKKQIPYVDYF